MKNNRFQLAEQGLAFGLPVLFLGLIVYASIGLIHDLVVSIKKEVMPMKTKASNAFMSCAKSILFSVWTVGANFLAGGALLA